jgi:SAM-dependent methyltransferase
VIDVRSLVVCPVCRGELGSTDRAMSCSRCSASYPIVGGVPALFHPESPFYPAGAGSRGGRPGGPAARALSRLRNWAPEHAIWLDRTLFEQLNLTPDDRVVLNLGSGVGRFDAYLKPTLRMINLDVYPAGGVHLLADGHHLPFADASLDGVFSNAVLEHVRKPWVVAAEMRRVLKPEGRVFVNVPFLNVIHASHDYFRFTDRGLEVLFEGFRPIASGVSAGPSSFLGPFLVDYLLCFAPGRVSRAILRRLAYGLTWPIKYFDLLIRRSEHLRYAADGFYFVGAKVA